MCVKLGNTAASFGGQELKFKNKGKLATDNLTALTNYSEENTDCSDMVIEELCHWFPINLVFTQLLSLPLDTRQPKQEEALISLTPGNSGEKKE